MFSNQQDKKQTTDTHLSRKITNIEELSVLCDHLSESNHHKSLQLTDINWGTSTDKSHDASQAATLLCSMLQKNYGLRSITWNGTPNKVDEKKIIAGLKRNFCITAFDMPCSDAGKKMISRILERNKQYRIAQQMMVAELLHDLTSTNAQITHAMDILATSIKSSATAEETSEHLLHLFLRAQFAEPDISKKTGSVISILRQLKFVGIEDGIPALQAAAAKNMLHYVRGLLAAGANVNAESFNGDTALMAAAVRGHTDIYHLLIANGADKTVVNDSGNNLLDLILHHRQFAIVKLSHPELPEEDKNRIIARRNLIVGFGPTLFTALPPARQAAERKISGGTHEGFHILAHYLERFARQQRDDQHVQHIAMSFKHAINNAVLSPHEHVSHLQTHHRLHIMTGCISHGIGARFKKLPHGSYRLTLSERGLFYILAPEVSPQRRPALQSIDVPANKIANVVKVLHQTVDCSADDAHKLLFQDIPKLVNSSWRYHPDSAQEKLKSGVCFYGNLKPLLRQEFKDLFGDNIGLCKYKEFSLFLRTELLNDYRNYFDDQDPYTFLASERLKTKQETYQTKYAMN